MGTGVMRNGGGGKSLGGMPGLGGFTRVPSHRGPVGALAP